MSVNSKTEVRLNNVRYPLVGQVQPILSSKFAQKQVIGDYTKDSDPYSSAWVMSDFRGGLLSEEMDEQTQANRYWFGTIDTRFNNELTLLPLATSVALPTVATPSITSPGAETASGWAGATQSNTYARSGTYSWRVNGSTEGYQDISTNPASDNFLGCYFTFKMWIYQPSGTGHSYLRLGINDGLTTTYSSTSSTMDSWVQMSVSMLISASATRVRLIIGNISGSSWGWFDDATLPDYPVRSSVALLFDEFNSALYMGSGNMIFKLNGTGSGWDEVASFGANTAVVSAMFHSNSNLFVYLGDSNQYGFINTSDVATLTTNAAGLNATKGIYWDQKVFKFSSAGACSVLTSPATATPSATASGTLPVSNNDLQEVFIYHDANGDDIIYAATKVGLYAHDYANALFLETSLLLPSQATAGKGAAVWHDAAYVSAGSSVYKYVVTNYATIYGVGLTRDDGLPPLYGGQIVKFIKGFDELFALVDSTYEGASSYSQVLSWDDTGWRTWWVDANVNKNMYAGIVSSVYAQRLWFSTTDGTYYIPLQANTRKPKKVSGYTYAASGAIITPWFDGDWQTGNKNALQLAVSCRDMSASETIIVKYRINHATIAVASTWTTLGTITSNGLTTYSFGTSLGVTFRDIQFRFELARGGTNTNSPVLEYARLSYEKVLPKRWGWQFTVDCTQVYGREGTIVAPDQLLDNLTTAAEVETLVPFAFDEITYYVRVFDVQGARLTGDGKQGTYTVLVVEVV